MRRAARNPTAAQPSATPKWAWAFVVACLALFAAGGAIGGALGAGGAAWCHGMARRADLSVTRRVAACAAIAGSCWVAYLTTVALILSL